MTKALLCMRCTTIRTFANDGRITMCECGTIAGWWEDASKGIARLYSETLMGREYGRVVGFHNGFLREATRSSKSDIFFRAAHEQAIDAPGYLFDRAKRGCWAVIITPGQSADTRWATDQEWDQKRLVDATERVAEPQHA